MHSVHSRHAGLDPNRESLEYKSEPIPLRRLAWSYDPESYADGSVAAGRVSHTGQVKGDDRDEKG
jgi:hypothetical protein